MPSHVSKAILALVAVVVLAFPVKAQSRDALMFGIDGYRHVPPFPKAVNDAAAAALLSAIPDFAGLAGHGTEVDGQNYLLPADVPGRWQPSAVPASPAAVRGAFAIGSERGAVGNHAVAAASEGLDPAQVLRSKAQPAGVSG